MNNKFIVFGLFLAIYSSNTLAGTDSLNIYTSKYKVKVGYAYNTFNRIIGGMFAKENISQLPSENPYFKIIYNQKERNITSLNASIDIAIKPRLTIGGTITGEFFMRSYNTDYKDTIFSVSESAKIFTLMPNAYFHYMKHKYIDLYLGGEIGIMIIGSENIELNYNYYYDKKISVLPTINFCPIGIQLKTVVSPYLQVNIGSRGWVEGGLVYNIK